MFAKVYDGQLCGFRVIFFLNILFVCSCGCFVFSFLNGDYLCLRAIFMRFFLERRRTQTPLFIYLKDVKAEEVTL